VCLFAAEPLFFGRKQILDLFYEFKKTFGFSFLGSFGAECTNGRQFRFS